MSLKSRLVPAFFNNSMSRKAKYWWPLLIFTLSLGGYSCKKCITCTARDSQTAEIKFSEKSCAKGPLLDDWEEGIKQAYPQPGYNTVCK